MNKMGNLRSSCVLVMLAVAGTGSFHARAQNTVDAKPAMWVVRDQDTTIYLFGTMAMLCGNVRWNKGKVKRAFEQSSEFLNEIDGANAAQAAKVSVDLAKLDKPVPLKDRLSPELLAQLESRVCPSCIDMPNLDRMKTWMVALIVSGLNQAGSCFRSEFSPNAVLDAQSRNRSIKRSALETVESQLRIFDNLSEANQVLFLEDSLANWDENALRMPRLQAVWAKGDETALDADMQETLNDVPFLRKPMMEDTNRRWADQIAKRMELPGTVFVAVTGGHLVGTDSVQKMLAKRGLKAKRVQ